MVEGVKFIVDDAGKKTAVIIGLEKWGELWEDIYDILVSESRRTNPPCPGIATAWWTFPWSST
jgi:hypothetical protein